MSCRSAGSTTSTVRSRKDCTDSFWGMLRGRGRDIRRHSSCLYRRLTGGKRDCKPQQVRDRLQHIIPASSIAVHTGARSSWMRNIRSSSGPGGHGRGQQQAGATAKQHPHRHGPDARDRTRGVRENVACVRYKRTAHLLQGSFAPAQVRLNACVREHPVSRVRSGKSSDTARSGQSRTGGYCGRRSFAIHRVAGQQGAAHADSVGST